MAKFYQDGAALDWRYAEVFHLSGSPEWQSMRDAASAQYAAVRRLMRIEE